MAKWGIRLAGGFFALMLMADLISTLLLWDLVKYLEVNPLFDSAGLGGIVALNLFFGGFLYFLYNRSKKTTNRFLYINLLVTVSILRIVVVFNNVQVYLSKPTLVQAQAVTEAAKQATMREFWWLTMIPYAIAIVSYWFFSRDHKIELLGEKE